MAEQSNKAPSNLIVYQQFPYQTTYKLETGSAQTVPGRLVKKGTTQGEVVINSLAGMPVGWLGFEQCHPYYIDGHSRTTAFATGDFVAVLSGGGGIMATLKNGEDLDRGAPVVAAANGEVAGASAIVVTIASGSTTVVSDKAQPDEAATGAYGSEGIIIGQLDEEGDASGGAALFKVRSAI